MEETNRLDVGSLCHPPMSLYVLIHAVEMRKNSSEKKAGE